MRFFSLLVLFSQLNFFAQTYSEVNRRFTTYLNYHGALDKYVEVTKENIIFYKYPGGKKETEFILPNADWMKLSALIKTVGEDSVLEILSAKIPVKNFAAQPVEKKKVLKGLRIMIDPGHIAGGMKMARTEQKFLHFTKANYPALKQDSLDIAEGMLTFQTASILKKMLEEKGVEVALTRSDNSTSFGCSYEEWLKKYKTRTLDSLLTIKKLTASKYKWLSKMTNAAFFVEFFKDHELQQRARVINAFKPDLTVIIHYNVNEKNVPWIKPSDKDVCMAFIPGCITADNIQNATGKLNLLRMLLTSDVDESEKISSLLVNELSKQLEIPVATTGDATYLGEHCMSTNSAGVYCRNLALCRLVKTPLMYGECLYQDCENECYELINNSENAFGVQTNKRVVRSARSFFNAINSFYSQ